MNKTVIKGIGIISELGNNPAEVLEHYEDDKMCRGGKLSYENRIDPSKMRRMSRLAKMLANTAADCIKCSNMEDFTKASNEVGIIMNTAYGPINTNIDFGGVIKNPELASPTDFANTVSNAAIGHVAIYFGLKGSSTLLMGSNVTGYTMRQLEKKASDYIIACSAEEYCTPIAEYARQKFHENLFSEGVVSLLLSSRGDSEFGYIIADAETGLGYSPLYSEVKDETTKFIRVMDKAMKKAGLTEADFDAVILASDPLTGIREYEEKAINQVFREQVKRIYSKDMLGETSGAGSLLNIALASILIKNERFHKIMVLGLEVSGTLEAYVISKD